MKRTTYLVEWSPKSACCRALTVGAILLCLYSASLRAQGVITTVAGGGPNSVPATTAALSFPSGLTVDSAGNLYIVDTGWHRVYKVTPSGQLTVLAGLGIIPFNNTLGDGGPAPAANLVSGNQANIGVAIDANGNVFIADVGNFRVRRVDALTGIITTVAGNGTRSSSGNGGPADAAGLISPTDVAVDRVGNLFILDNGIVRRVDAVTQIITAYAGGSPVCATPANAVGDGCPATQASLSATSLVVDTSGNVFIADAVSFQSGNNRIRRVDAATGIINTYAGTGVQGYTGDGGNATLADLNTPLSIAMDPANNLFILDSGNNVIRKVDTSQNISSEVALTAGSFSPFGLAVNASDLLFFNSLNANITDRQVMQADPSTLSIVAVVGNGSQDFSGEGVLATDAKLEEVNGVAADGAGNLAIADTENFRIRYVDGLTGDITTVAGNGTPCFSANCVTEGAIATTVSLHTPVAVIFSTSPICGTCLIFTDGTYIRQLSGNVITTYVQDPRFQQLTGLAMDGSQNLYIGDNGNVVWKVDSSKNVTVFAGGGGLCAAATNSVGDNCPATSAQLALPFAVALDNGFNLYIAEQNHNRVRRVDAGNGIITTVAGNGLSGYTGDGGLATSAEISAPNGVAVDSGGDIFIADTGNSVIREVNFTTGVITTVVNGSGNIDFTGDGGPPLCAALNFPVGLSLGPLNNALGDSFLWIADDFSNRVRRIPLPPSTQNACVIVASSRDSSVIGQPVTFTATIAKSISGNPSGTVTFSDGATPLNTANVNGGQATLTTSSLAVGSHVITATYSGDGTFSSSTSSAITQVVLSNTPSTAAPTHFSVSAPSTATSGTPFSVTVTALDASNNVVTGYTGTVHFTSSDGQAVLPPDYAFTSSDNGSHVFSITLKTPGSQAISVTDTANASITGASSGITVSAGTATHFAVSAPASAVSGTVFNVTVTAEDQFSNTMTGYTGTVQFTSTDAQATLPPAYTFISADSGTHVFSVTLKTAGNQTVTVTDLSNAITGSASINVLGPIQLNVSESISVNDVPVVLPSAMITVPESITVSDVPAVLPSLMIMVPESITVTDAPATLPALQINVAENISVTDVPSIQPQGASTTTSITVRGGASGITYGTPANVTVTVVASNGGGAVSGNVFLSVDGGAPISMPLSIGSIFSLNNASAVFNLGVLGAGSHSLTANFAAQGNFLASAATSTLNVAPAPLTITANSIAKILNAPNPALGGTPSGFVNGDNASVLTSNPTCATTATATSPVGGYSITCSGAAAVNYTFVYVAGTLSIQYATAIGHVILSPINANGTSVFKQGQTVPTKFAVYDANGVSIGTPGVVSRFLLTGIVSGTTTTNVETVVDTNNPDTAFRWDPTSQQWIFNISTANLLAGNTYVFTITLNDGSTIMFQFGLR